MTITLESPEALRTPVGVNGNANEASSFVLPTISTSSWRVRREPRVEVFDRETSIPDRQLGKIHLKAVAALATHATFVTQEGKWHTASTLRGAKPPEQSPQPEVGDTWLELAIKCDPWELTGRLHDNPRPWDISRSQLKIKKLVEKADGSGTEVQNLFTISSDSDFYRPSLRGGDGKVIPEKSNDFGRALRQVKGLVNDKLSSLGK